MFLFLIPVILLAGATAIGIGAEIVQSTSPQPAAQEDHPQLRPVTPAPAKSAPEPKS